MQPNKGFHAPATHGGGHKPNRKIFNKHRHARTFSRIWDKHKRREMKLPKNSSPHLGYLRHAPNTTTRTRRSRSRSRRSTDAVFRSTLDPHVHSSASPYVGFIRHAPPSTGTYHSKNSNRSSSKNKKADSNAVWEEYLQQYNCSGHLPGGNNEDVACRHNYNYMKFTSYSFCRWFEASPSSGLFQESEYVRDAINPLDSPLDMLDKLAYWFLFPIANDAATYTFRETNEVDYLHDVASIVGPFFSSLLRKVLQIDFSHSVGTTFQDSVGAEGLTQCQVSNHSLQDSLSSLPTSAPHRQTTERTIQEIDEELVANSEENNLFRSISSIDSDEIKSQNQRHLDIESILKLPTITFGEDTSNSGMDSIDICECDASSDATNFKLTNEEGATKGLEWSWIAVPKDLSESTESLLESLPEAQRALNKDDRCVICLETFQKGDRLRVLPCAHRFHCCCIDKWLSGSFSYDNCLNSSCPTCKSIPTVDDDSGPLQSIESMISMGSLVELCDDDSMQSLNLDGSVPSWAFARLGSKIAD